jgi:hypothetical protein
MVGARSVRHVTPDGTMIGVREEST